MKNQNNKGLWIFTIAVIVLGYVAFHPHEENSGADVSLLTHLVNSVAGSGSPTQKPAQEEKLLPFPKTDTAEFEHRFIAACFLSDIFSALSGYPQPDFKHYYSLKNLRVMQTTPDGVLVQIDPRALANPTDVTQPAMVATSDSFVDGSELSGRWAYYEGTYDYVTVLGARKKIHKFVMMPREYIQELVNKREPNFIAVNGRVVPNPNKRQPA